MNRYEVIECTGAGDPSVLRVASRAKTDPGPDEVRIRIRATAVNRADILQRMGRYPAPTGSPSDILGLEYAGEIEAVGAGCTRLHIGDRVFGIAGGGTYASCVVLPEAQVAKAPSQLSFVELAALPEAFLTAYDALFVRTQTPFAKGSGADLQMVIHAAASGVGTAAVQLARFVGAAICGTTRAAAKAKALNERGFGPCIALAPPSSNSPLSWEEAIHAIHMLTPLPSHILDLVGGDYVGLDLAIAAPKSDIILVGLVAGSKTELPLGLLLQKRLTLHGTVLRSRTPEEKATLAQELELTLGPLFARGELHPVVDQVFPLHEAARAHQAIEANELIGKAVLEVS
jgi:NADPH:quinone reductase